MRSIQSKFIALILLCVFLCATFIGGAGVYSSHKVLDQDAAQIMNLMCSDKAKELNALLTRIQQSVQTLARYTSEQLDDLGRLKNDEAYRDTYTRRLEEVAVNAANNTEGALAVYVRYNPAFTPPTSGLFWSKTASNGSFQRLIPTDFSSYSPEDSEHVGWYYIPVKNGKDTWITPYLNQNINTYMISYVIPLYKENETVGVVGMDIDFELIRDTVSDVRAYQSGYAFLVGSDAKVLGHKELPIGVSMERTDSSLAPVVRELKNETSGSTLFSYQWKGEHKKMAFRSLVNGMTLVLTAPRAEINQARNSLIAQISVVVLLISAFSIALTIWLTKKMIRPLRELTLAAQKIAAGDLNISLDYQTKDEVGLLADSFLQTVGHLQEYIQYINGLAYRDSLTGNKNQTAYQEAARRLEEKMRSGQPEFAVVVLDLNGLKEVNDRYGHDFGDMLIIDASRLISRSFKRSPVYRIGGDEFVVILENDDFEHYQELLQGFEANMTEHNQSTRADQQLSIARGIALYNHETDLVFGNVFKRADEAMYHNKKEMKNLPVVQETSSIIPVE